ncbi:hypothetical protein PDESU_05613 [Pontiella desulfatans]|uniref:Tetratricopeptide repeat protein n=1 Tax=Pontiella desulfatans TaxID=2750659 RepID=A0A6C2UAU0_PONDE|nr:hypothetical protein [Pontiella desulfatans]VGO17019.1 hypothetical protein PDESU_05613 [Pontiella desulfatans]
MRWRNSLLLLLLAGSAEAAYVVTQSGRQINGTQISAAEDGSVTLVTATGQKMTFRKGQYRSASADRPPELAQAERLLLEGQGEKAVPLLEIVKADCRFLAWDQNAILLLANHYYATGQFAQAATEFQRLEKQDADVQAKLREAMVKSGQTGSVLPVLEQDIATGTREAAAQAYLMRGDLKAAQGDTQGARRDWLKVATFFKAQQELAKTAEQKLGQQEDLPQKNAK